MRPVRSIAFAVALTTAGCSMVQDLGGNLDGGDASSIDDVTTDAGLAAEGGGKDVAPDGIMAPESGYATADATIDAVDEVDAAASDGIAPDALIDADAATATDAGADAPDGTSPDAADGEAGPPATCSTGQLSWARVAPGRAYSVAARTGGSAFVQGQFVGSSTVVMADGGTSTVTSAGSYDTYLALYDADGTVTWIQSVGGIYGDYPKAVVVAPGGGALMTGVFTGLSSTFGAGQAGATTLTASAGGSATYLARYDGAGNLLWAKAVPGAAGAPGTAHPNAVGIAPDGTSVMVGGLYGHDVTFGPGEPGETTLQMPAGVQIAGFVARYAADGHLIWAKEIVGDANADVMGVAVAADDSFYVTGGFGGTTVFGKGEPNETTFTSVVSELFLAHYNADGTLAWVKRTLGSPPDGGVGFGIDSRNVALAPEGVLLVSGDFGNPAVFGPGEANQTAISPINYLYTDMFVASFDLTGELRWVRHVGASPATPNWMSSLGLAAVPGGGAAVTGEFEGPVTFGQGESHETTLVGGGAYEGFAARYEADGKLGWAKLFDSDGGEAEGYGISSVPGDCTLFVTGLLDNSGIFGIGETGATTLTADAGAGFVLRMQP